ncbi:MAG: TonB-dependent receptor [Ignavibacteriae bacterium]|nr:TonB-dependent receptor [Ignavibacteriota bacterium]MCB9205750.1 TonB-dependent receptor [Ignavibacteriales bacterium]MCB9209912.1 TonB-dependent receptor [Ignavibacteriales bacterium]MCB9260260.1 TonB-dependent receptor [Ignavibacteriales bacterium]
MKLNKTFLLLILISTIISAQNYSIFGIVKSDSIISGVQVYIEENNEIASTNTQGKFNFQKLSKGKYNLLFNHIGFKSKNIIVEINESDVQIEVTLEPNTIELSEAIVISSRKETAIRDLSLSLEYIGEAEIQKSSKITISDLLKNESGISVVRDAPWATTINVRGLSKQNLVYLIDGSRIETSTNLAAGLSLFNLNDIENIEIIKSGGSSLYGSGATGGIINILTKQVELRNHLFVKSQIINSYNSVNNGYNNYVNLKLGDSFWGLKLSGAFRRADDTKIPSGKLSNSSFNDEGINASFLLSPMDNVNFIFDYQKFNAFDVGIPGGDPFTSSASAKYKSAKRNLYNATIELNNIAKYLLKAKIKYYNQVISRSVEVRPNQLVKSNPQADHFTNGILLQTDWYLVKENYLITGIDIWQREYNGLRTVTNRSKNIITVDKPVPDSKFRNLGVYAKDDLSLINNKLLLSLSIRYDLINILNDKTLNPLYVIKNGEKSYPVNKLASFEESDVMNNSISGGLGIIYKLTPKLDLITNYAYNFRSPSLEERFQYIDLGGIIYLGNPQLKPEESFYFDAGIRVWEKDLQVNFNTFGNVFNNLVVDNSFIPDSIYMKKNVGKAFLYGFDFRVDYNFYKNISAYLNTSFVRGRDIKMESDLSEIPPLHGIIGFTITIKNYLSCEISANISADQNKVGSDENRTPGFTYFDFSISTEKFNYGLTNISLSVGIENIFNRKYREHLSTYRGINLFEPGRNIFAKLILELD